MRIMQVVTSPKGWGGAENLVCLLANALAKKSTSFLLAPRGHPLFTRVSTKVQGVPLTIGNGFNPMAVMAFVRLLRREKIDVVDMHSSHAHNLALFVRYLLPRVKIVVHRHNLFSPTPNLFSRYKYLYAGVDRFICVSQAVRDILLRYGVAPQRAVTIFGAVPASNYRKRATSQQRQELCHQYRLKQELPLIGTVANLLTHTKGYDTLLQALAILKRAGVPFQAIICGEGADQEKLENTCRYLDLQQDVRFVGFVDDVVPLLTAMDVFCFPTRREALGLAVQEAAHAGCCIVATRAGGVVEMIEHQHSGLLSAVGDASALAANLKHVLLDEKMRQRLAKNGRRDIGKKFSVNRMVADTAKIYHELLTSK